MEKNHVIYPLFQNSQKYSICNIRIYIIIIKYAKSSNNTNACNIKIKKNLQENVSLKSTIKIIE